jgi:hypothetical protein
MFEKGEGTYPKDLKIARNYRNLYNSKGFKEKCKKALMDNDLNDLFNAKV